ncbi:MAG TPA: hypothetical protein VHL99_09505 [Candidatus Binatia bacterium]|jgi:hypothetical protein|nr:hypothetical protein [Candidatus Binatia bacterium]
MRRRRDRKTREPRRDAKIAMQVGDRILVNKGIAKRVYLIARTEIPHSSEKIFVTKSGGDFTIGVKVWKSDYVWSDKSRMWVPKR